MPSPSAIRSAVAVLSPVTRTVRMPSFFSCVIAELASGRVFRDLSKRLNGGECGLPKGEGAGLQLRECQHAILPITPDGQGAALPISPGHCPHVQRQTLPAFP